MTANRLHFHKQSAAAPVGSTQPGDSVVGVRGGGFVNIPLDLLSGAMGIQNWDAAATEQVVPFEVIPFTRLNEISDPNGIYVAATTNVAKTKVIKAAQVGSDEIAAGQLAGRLPSTGKFWFIVTTDAGPMDVDDNNWVEVNFSTNPRFADSAPDDGIVCATGWGYDYGWLRQVDLGDGLTGVRKYLYCVDIDAGKVDMYASNGLSATDTIAAVNGQPALAGAFINCAVWNTDGAAGEMTFSITPGDTPFAIPGGYSPLVMREAQSTAAQGKINMPTTTSIIRDYHLVKGHIYYVDADDNVLELPKIALTPKLNEKNIFTKPSVFLEGIELLYAWMLRSYQNGSLLLMPRWQTKSALETRAENITMGWNIVIGNDSISKMTSGQMNVVVGSTMAPKATTLSHNVMMGYGLGEARFLSDTIAFGRGIAGGLVESQGTTIIGAAAVGVIGWKLQNCTMLGVSTLGAAGGTDPVWNSSNWATSPVTMISGITAIGAGAYYNGKLGDYNTAIGAGAYSYYGTGVYGTGVGANNTMVGADALSNRQGDNSRVTAVGKGAMMLCRSADDAVAVGFESQWGIVGHRNVSVGVGSLKNATQGAGTNDDCTAVGYQAMQNLTGITNSSALGKGATVTGSNQVQLGDSSTTTYAYGAVQNRSDSRDKREVRDTVLGLDFLMRLRPVDFKLDLREDYIDWNTRPVAPEVLRNEPMPPQMPHTEEGYQEALLAYRLDKLKWDEEKAEYDEVYEAWARAAAQWDEANLLANIETDGSKMRSRFHHGFLAQELKAAADSMGLDFGGYQDHLINGGQDVKSIGYEEMIGPIVRSIQQLHEHVNSDAFVDRIASRMMEMMAAARNGG